MAKAKVDRILTNRERKVFRKHIPRVEVWFGAGFIVFVLIMGGWFAAQEDAYDPADRDITMEVMEAGAVEDKLYRTPLQRWVDPAKAMMAGGVAQAAVDTGIFPATILDGGWTISGRVQAFTPQTVYEKINGAADQYIQYGLDQAFFVGLENPAAGISTNLEVYYHKTFANALGIFSAQRDPDKVVESGEDAYFYPTTVGLIGIAGPYYFKVTGAQEGEPTLAKAKQLAGMMAKMSEGKGEVPAGFEVFATDLAVPFGDIQFQKEDVFQFAFAKDFWFGQLPDNGPRLFLHEAPDEAAADALLKQLVDNSLMEYTATEQNPDGAVLKHKFIEDVLLFNKRGSMVYGLDGTADLNAAHEKLQTLEGALFGEEQPY